MVRINFLWSWHKAETFQQSHKVTNDALFAQRAGKCHFNLGAGVQVTTTQTWWSWNTHTVENTELCVMIRSGCLVHLLGHDEDVQHLVGQFMSLLINRWTAGLGIRWLVSGLYRTIRDVGHKECFAGLPWWNAASSINWFIKLGDIPWLQPQGHQGVWQGEFVGSNH